MYADVLDADEEHRVRVIDFDRCVPRWGFRHGLRFAGA